MERKLFCKQYIRREIERLVKNKSVLKSMCPEALSHIRSEHIYVSDVELIDKAYRQTGNASKFASEEEAENCIERMLYEGFETFYRLYREAYDKERTCFKMTLYLEGVQLTGFMLNRKSRVMHEAKTPYVSVVFRVDHSTDVRLPFGTYIQTAFPEMFPPISAIKGGTKIPYTDRNILPEILETEWYSMQDTFTKGYVRLAQDTENGYDTWLTPSGGGKIVVKFSYHAVLAEICIQKFGQSTTFRIKTTVGKRTDTFCPERQRDMEALRRLRPGTLAAYEEIRTLFD